MNSQLLFVFKIKELRSPLRLLWDVAENLL